MYTAVLVTSIEGNDVELQFMNVQSVLRAASLIGKCLERRHCPALLVCFSQKENAFKKPILL